MRFKSTKVPEIVDYILDYMAGALLVATPWIFNFDNGGAETWVPVIAGIMALLQIILTNLERGIIHKHPIITHIRMDLVIGLFLAASPWIFDFDEIVWMPRIIFGVFCVVASIMTETVPASGSGNTNHQAPYHHQS